MEFQNPSAATRDATTGVHSPAISDIPLIIATAPRATNAAGGSARSLVSQYVITAMPATKRIRRRPAPGQPCAKDENRRLKRFPLLRFAHRQATGKAPKGPSPHSFQSLELD